MKIVILILTLVTLTSCSSLITRKELNSCNQKCGNKIEKISKEDGKVSCECKSEQVSFVPCWL